MASVQSEWSNCLSLACGCPCLHAKLVKIARLKRRWPVVANAADELDKAESTFSELLAQADELGLRTLPQVRVPSLASLVVPLF